MWQELHHPWVPLLLLSLYGVAVAEIGGTESSLSDRPDLSTLVAVQVLFRHGARSIEKSYPTDPYGSEEFWPEGFQQLRCIGKVQCFNLGRLLRQRYSTFINTTYVRREIHMLSSDTDRAIQSANAVLAGFYPPNEKVEDCGNIPWKDVPVHSIPYDMDNILHQRASCPKLDENFIRSPILKDFAEANIDVFRSIANNTNVADPTDMALLGQYYDALMIEDYFNLTLPDWARSVIRNGSRTTDFQVLTHTEEMKRFLAGPLLNRLIYNFNLTLQGKVKGGREEEGRLLYLISGHDYTITSFLDTLGLLLHNPMPQFASAVILELHKVPDTQDLQIQLFSKTETNNDTIEWLEIPECPNPCLYKDFLTLVENYQMDHSAWSKACQASGKVSEIVLKWTGWTLISLTSLILLVTLGLWGRSISARKRQQHYATL